MSKVNLQMCCSQMNFTSVLKVSVDDSISLNVVYTFRIPLHLLFVLTQMET